jgi:hypothetical protein
MSGELQSRGVGKPIRLPVVHGRKRWSLRVVALAACAALVQACASLPHRQFETFPTAEELGTPRSQQSRYEEARVDFQRAAKGMPPRYAVWHSALYDGGTTFYRGVGYEVTVWKRLSTAPNGGTYLHAGPEIHFTRPLSPRGPASYSVARTRKIK